MKTLIGLEYEDHIAVVACLETNFPLFSHLLFFLSFIAEVNLCSNA